MKKRNLFLNVNDGKFLYLIEKWNHLGFDYVGIKNSDKSFAMFEDDKLHVISFDYDLTFRSNFSIDRKLLVVITWTFDYFISIME